MHKTLTLAALLLGSAALAQPNEDWTAVNLAASDRHVIPRYAALAESGAGLRDAAEAFCAVPEAGSLEELREAWHRAMDDWQGIQHVQFGPITYFNWNYRLQYWPDEKDTGGRQLDALIAAADPEVLRSDNFERRSVGVQGFPALERLLFAEDALEELRTDDYRCQLALTIAGNISGIAAGVHERWVSEFRDTVADADADQQGHFESAQDATVDFLKALVESVPRLRDQKLGLALGESAERARPQRAESWRAGRSLRNLKLNLAALQDLFEGGEDRATTLSSVFRPEDANLVSAHFVELRALLEALPDGLAPALEEAAGHAELQAVHEALDALYESMETALKNTDLYLGFNSLDGD